MSGANGMDVRLLAVARAAKGFMPDAEGLALYECGLAAARFGPLLEIGSYCGKSAVYLGAAAKDAGTVVFSVDHHRGSEENQVGWTHHDPQVVDDRTAQMDTLAWFRSTIRDAELEGTVIGVVGPSVVVASHWRTPVGLLFIDGGHAAEVAMADYESWARWVTPGGYLAVHDVFEDPRDGGQAPYLVWQRARASGEFEPVARLGHGSLRVLRRSG